MLYLCVCLCYGVKINFIKRISEKTNFGVDHMRKIFFGYFKILQCVFFSVNKTNCWSIDRRLKNCLIISRGKIYGRMESW